MLRGIGRILVVVALTMGVVIDCATAAPIFGEPASSQPAPRAVRAPASAAALETRTFTIADRGTLKLTIPGDWVDALSKPAFGSSQPAVLTLSPPEGQKFKMKVNITSAPRRSTDPQYLVEIRKLAEANGNKVLKAAKETTLELKKLNGPEARGFMYSLSDRNPKGTFQNNVGGMVGVRELMLAVTISYNDPEIPLRDAALEIIKSATYAPVVAASAPASKPTSAPAELRLASPDEKWDAVVKNPGLMDIETSPARGNLRDIAASNATAGWTLSILIAPGIAGGDAKAARDSFMARAKRGLDKQNVKLGGDATRATVEYIVPALNQKTADVCFARDGIWVDMRLAKNDFDDKDQTTFDEVLKSARLEPHK